jgi:hypothetical protein
MKMEIWKDIVGYENLYQVSNFGRIKSLPKTIVIYNGAITTRKEKILKPGTRAKFYKFVTLTNGKESKHFGVHRLVANAFIPNPNNYPEVNHKDENPENNRFDNLEWCDRAYNINYSKAKAVVMCNLDGVEIKRFSSIKKAHDETGISRTAINNTLKGYTRTSGGYKWRYAI